MSKYNATTIIYYNTGQKVLFIICLWKTEDLFTFLVTVKTEEKVKLSN